MFVITTLIFPKSWALDESLWKLTKSELFVYNSTYDVYKTKKINSPKIHYTFLICFSSQILRNHVMVRVGGGWDTLQHYLDKHDPCRCKAGKWITFVPDGMFLPLTLFNLWSFKSLNFCFISFFSAASPRLFKKGTHSNLLFIELFVYSLIF